LNDTAIKRGDPVHGGPPLPLDALIVPGLLLLVARDLLVNDPSWSLGWRLLHEPRLHPTPRGLSAFMPQPSPPLDMDPVALVLSAIAVGLALCYVVAALVKARPAVRAFLISLGSLALVVAPTLAFVIVGRIADRPFGQDGGVVQLPLALDKVLAGQSPYGADYSDSILGKESRVSDFWGPLGGNPILHHHAYLPGTHLIMMPFYLISRTLFHGFDPRLVSTLAYLIAIVLASRVATDPARRLAAAAIVAINPLVYWQQAFGANDMIFVALLLGAALLAHKGHVTLSGVSLGLACAAKQLAWPFAPFLLLHFSGAKSLRQLTESRVLARMARPGLTALIVFASCVAPIAALDFRAFWGDIVVYNVGLPGGDNYPLGGTPGFGFANWLIYFGAVKSLRDYFPFGVFYLVLIPVGFLLARIQVRRGGAFTALVGGSVALVCFLYFSRVVHANYLIAAAVLIPLGILAKSAPACLAIPLLLLGLASEMVQRAPFREIWHEVVAVGLLRHTSGFIVALAPRAPALTNDPLGLAVSATAAGLAVVYAAAVFLNVPRGLRNWIVVGAALLLIVVPASLVMTIGEKTGLRFASEAWALQAQADAESLHALRSPYTEPRESRPLGREAWSRSFRQDPPRALVLEQPLMPPGAAVLDLLLRPFWTHDPRVLSLFLYGLLMLLVGRALSRDRRELALGLLFLAPAPVAGIVFGSSVALGLGCILGAFALRRSGHPLVASIFMGVACALDHRSWLAAPFLLLPDRQKGSGRPIVGLLLSYSALVGPVALIDLSAFRTALAGRSMLGPGVGLANFLLYWGKESTVAAHVLFALVPLLPAAALLWLLRPNARAVASPAFLAGCVLLLVLFLGREAPPEALWLPTALFVWAGLTWSPSEGVGTQ